jgi:hypothetical protein
MDGTKSIFIGDPKILASSTYTGYVLEQPVANIGHAKDSVFRW